jgi:hypothetical protein
MWVQHHNGIFVSSDEGKTFSEIKGVEPSTFGFPVVVHPREPDTAWFVPEVKDEKRIPPDGKLIRIAVAARPSAAAPAGTRHHQFAFARAAGKAS